MAFVTPNLEDALLTLTAAEMYRLGWEVVPEQLDVDTGVVLVPAHVIVPDVFRCQRCRASMPRRKWQDFTKDVRTIARFAEDFICNACMRHEFIYKGYLRSQLLRDMNMPQALIDAMVARPAIQRARGPVPNPPNRSRGRASQAP